MDTILCRRTQRVLRKDFTVAYNHKLYQIEETIYASKVMFHDRIDGSVRIDCKDRALRFNEITERPLKELKESMVVPKKRFTPPKVLR